VREDVEQGRLVRILPDWEPDPVELHALYPSRLDSSPKVRVFLQFLRERSESSHGSHELKQELVQSPPMA
jgi:DNA-binding transcriptional LysR family regulator